MSHALLRYKRSAHASFAHRESPLIADAVIIQGGLHLLRGQKILKERVSEALYLIVQNNRISRDMHTNTWLFCAVARAEGPSSLLTPLRSAVLSNFVQLLSRESDKARLAAAAACIALRAVPSEMAFEIESILVDAIRASLPSFQSKFGPWVLRSQPSLPQAIQFLLRAYAKHPLQQELRSSEKRPRWEPAQRDAAQFFDFLSLHVRDSLKVDGDTLPWDEETFRSRMGAIRILYMTASENAIYSSALHFADGRETKARKTFASGNEFLRSSSKTHDILKLILRTTQLPNFEAYSSGVGLQLVFQAIIAIANFSFAVVNDFLPEIMEMFLTPQKHQDTSVHMHHKREFFCALLNIYERSRSVDKFVSHLMGNFRVLQALVPILKHRAVQIALASAFRNLRGAEGQMCLQSLVGKSLSSSTDVVGLTLISSLLLETSSGPLLNLAADTIANDVVDVLLAHTHDPDSRHCRTYLLASFLLARTAHKSLCTKRTVRVGIFRLAFQGSKEDERTSGEKLESKIIDALSSGEESLSPAELCSNLRCLAALTHYVFRYQDSGADYRLISRAVCASLRHFRVLTNLSKKPNSPTITLSSLPRTLYDTRSLEAPLRWIGSIGYVLRRHLYEVGDEAIEEFLKHAFLFFPGVHPFWRELSEETRCAPKISKVAVLVLKDLSDRTKCSKRVRICSPSRVLETLSVLPAPFLNGPNQQELLDCLLACITSPCCLKSRQHALKASLKLQNSPGFRTSLLTLCGRQDNRHILEQNRRLQREPAEKSGLWPHENITSAMRVLTSLVPEQLHPLLESEVASVLTAGISRIQTDFETELKPSCSSPAALCGLAEVLIDLRGNLHTIKAKDMGSSKVQLLEKTTTECIKALLPVCLKFLSKDAHDKTSLSQVASSTLSAIARGTSPKYGSSFHEFSDTIRNDQIRVCVSCLFHPQEDVQKLAILLLSAVSVSGEISMHALNQIFLTLFDRFFVRAQKSLSCFLSNDTLPVEAVRKDILVLTKLSACCYLSCSTTPMKRNATSFERRDSDTSSDLQAYNDPCFLANIRLLHHLEVFVGIWSRAVQDMSERQLGKFRASGLLSVSDDLVCSLLQNCLRIINADRYWRREDVEKCLLVTKQVVERVCAGVSFLENEGTALVAALRICRSAAKRYTALVPATTKIICLLFGRSLSTGNETLLIAVREAVEEICIFTRTWESLSALLADCSIALTHVVGTECRREAERTVATLFKAVSEPKAQQVLGSLPDSGKEALTHIWQMYSDSFAYSGN